MNTNYSMSTQKQGTGDDSGAEAEIIGALRWRHNGRDGVSNHQPHDCLLNRLFRRISKKISEPRVTGLCAGNSPLTGEFPSQRASDAEMFPFDDVIMEDDQYQVT